MDAKQRVIDAGFPRAAEFLDGTPEGARLAMRELARFKPSSMGEALAKDRALRSIPEVAEQEDGAVEFWQKRTPTR